MNTTHEYTNEQIQAAIDAAFLRQDELPFRNLQTYADGIYWPQEAPNRLAIARAFLAALPKPGTYARLKAYNEVGARIRCGIKGLPIDIGWSTRSAWQWSEPVDQYEVHPDDLHMVPDYAPKPKSWTLPAPPAGFCWHREDWTQDMLPEGWRPLLEDEHVQSGDQVRSEDFVNGYWTEHKGCEWRNNASADEYREWFFRTRRPLPAEASAEPEQAEVGINGLTDEQTQATASVSGLSKPADDGPAWIPHDGGPCPLKDCEVEEWEYKARDGFRASCHSGRPSQCILWEHSGGCMDIIAYRVLKWKPGHGPQEASKADEPATFEAHGKTWTRHMPGDPCPCDPRASVYVAFKDGTFSGRPGLAVNWAWGTYLPDSEWLIGWRYAAEPAPAEAANTDTEWNEYQQELMSPLPKPWTPRPGDVVRLKSGGPKMTILDPEEDGEFWCLWFDTKGFNHRFFPAACLTPAKEGQP